MVDKSLQWNPLRDVFLNFQNTYVASFVCPYVYERVFMCDQYVMEA